MTAPATQNTAGTLGLRDGPRPALTRLDQALRNGVDPDLAERLWGRLPDLDAIPLIDPLTDAAPKSGDYLRLWRADAAHSEDTWYIVVRLPDGGRKLISTRSRGDDPQGARVVYLMWLAAENQRARERYAPERAPVLSALDWARAWLNGRCFTLGKIKPNSLNNFLVELAVAVPFFEGWRIDDVGLLTSATFMDWATRSRTDGGRLYSHSTSRAAISLVRTCLNAFLTEMRSPVRVNYEIPATAMVFHNAYKPWEIERLRGTLAGRRWDKAAQDWMWETDPETGEKTPAMHPPAEVRLREPYVRLFVMGLKLGARIDDLMKATWVQRGTVFADVKKRIFHRRGLKRKESRNKRRYACKMPESLGVELDAFLALDIRRGRGRCHVIQRQDGRGLSEPDYVRWHALHEECDVAPRGFHALKHTCVEILRARGVPLVLAAEFLATRPQTLIETYGDDWDDATQSIPAAALDDLDGWIA